MPKFWANIDCKTRDDVIEEIEVGCECSSSQLPQSPPKESKLLSTLKILENP